MINNNAISSKNNTMKDNLFIVKYFCLIEFKTIDK